MAKTLDNTRISVSQQLFNTDSTTIQHSDSVGQSENGHKLDMASNLALHKISQQTTGEKGEREGLESSPPNGVLQNSGQGKRGEGEMEISSSPTPSQSPTPSEPVVNDRETFNIGDRVVDFPSGFKGFVMEFKGEFAG
jgi:hypothetical protein